MRGYMLLERQRSVPLSLHGILSIMTQIALLMWWLATLLLLAGYMCVDGYHLRTSFLWFYRTAFLNKVNSSECYIFSLQGMIIAYWGSKTYRLCNFLYLFNMDATAIFPYVLIPFFPHLSETSVDSYLVVIFSPYLSFGLLDLEKLRASLGLIQFIPYIWL